MKCLPGSDNLKVDFKLDVNCYMEGLNEKRRLHWQQTILFSTG
jgi:hypothetical protein